jgi:hypothetical protein
MIACPVASKPPPKAPCTTRETISIVSDSDAPHATDASVKPMIDTRK